jgi:hypothetical protein
MHVNFFCDSSEGWLDWRKTYIVADDGGDCYFRVKFDIESQTYSDLDVNGEA